MYRHGVSSYSEEDAKLASGMDNEDDGLGMEPGVTPGE